MAKFVLQDGSEIEAFTAEELKEKIDTEVAGLKAKRDELLGLHTKDKERLSELEKAQREAEEARQKEKGEFKQLYEKTQAELEAERDQARKFRQQIQEREIEAAVIALVGSMTRDTARFNLLKKEALQFAKYTESGVQFELGGVSVEAEKLREKLATDYPFLVDGSGASGGGAQGGSRTGQAGKKFNEYSGAELIAIKRESPAEYERLKREFHQT